MESQSLLSSGFFLRGTVGGLVKLSYDIHESVGNRECSSFCCAHWAAFSPL